MNKFNWDKADRVATWVATVWGVFFIAWVMFGWLIDWWLVGGIVLAAKMFIDAFRMEREEKSDDE